MLALISKLVVLVRAGIHGFRRFFNEAGEPDSATLYQECLLAEHKHRSTGVGHTIDLMRSVTRGVKETVPCWVLLTLAYQTKHGSVLRNKIVILDIKQPNRQIHGHETHMLIALLEHLNHMTRIHHGDYTLVSWMEIPPQAQEHAEALDVALSAGSSFRVRRNILMGDEG